MDKLEEVMNRIQKMMKKNGIQSGTPSEQTDVCPLCNGTGLEYVPDGGQGGFRICRCGIRDKEIMENRLSFASIPKNFKGIRLDSFAIDAYRNEKCRFEAREAIKAIKYWLDNFEALQEQGMGLFLYSNAKGSGKTRAAISIANELMEEKGIQVKFCTSLQILNEIKASWNDKASECNENELLNHLSTTEVLIIDDFGVEQSDKPWINERFYQIVNNRYINRKLTIYTCNESLDRLRYDERITNRIKECAFQVPFPEESVRDIIAKRNARMLKEGMKKYD